MAPETCWARSLGPRKEDTKAAGSSAAPALTLLLSGRGLPGPAARAALDTGRRCEKLQVRGVSRHRSGSRAAPLPLRGDGKRKRWEGRDSSRCCCRWTDRWAGGKIEKALHRPGRCRGKRSRRLRKAEHREMWEGRCREARRSHNRKRTNSRRVSVAARGSSPL